MADFKVHVFLMCHNEQALLPATVRHYQKALPDCPITIFDNMSTDDSVKLAVAAKCRVVPWDSPVEGQLHEPTMTRIKNHDWKQFVSRDTWIIMCDMDEWLDVTLAELQEEDARGTTILLTKAVQMVGESLCKDLSDIDISKVEKGYPDPVYAKRLCFKWDAVDPGFYDGCHTGKPIGTLFHSISEYRIRHMNALGAPYLADKHARRYARNTMNRELLGLSCHYLPERYRVYELHAEMLAKAAVLPKPLAMQAWR